MHASLVKTIFYAMYIMLCELLFYAMYITLCELLVSILFKLTIRGLKSQDKKILWTRRCEVNKRKLARPKKGTGKSLCIEQTTVSLRHTRPYSGQ